MKPDVFNSQKVLSGWDRRRNLHADLLEAYVVKRSLVNSELKDEGAQTRGGPRDCSSRDGCSRLRNFEPNVTSGVPTVNGARGFCHVKHKRTWVGNSVEDGETDL